MDGELWGDASVTHPAGTFAGVVHGMTPIRTFARPWKEAKGAGSLWRTVQEGPQR